MQQHSQRRAPVPADADHVLQMRQTTVRFGPVIANSDVDFDLRRGEIHALLGENGAGKTTLMRVLAGLIRADSGEILIDGSLAEIDSVPAASQAGIGMVHQHFMLVPSMTVAENVCLGLPSAGRVKVDVRRVSAELAALSEKHGLRIDPTAKVNDLSVGQQQRVEIIKALYRQARILILDEPTAVLTPAEADSLLGVLRSLAAQGTSVVFISHKLGEVLAVADRVSVLRRGRLIETVDAADTDVKKLAELMVGREVAVGEASQRPSSEQPARPVLELRDLRFKDRSAVARLDGFSLSLYPGEIVGIAGVDGNGQRELAEVICGLAPLASGQVLINGSDVSGSSVVKRMAAGLAHVPEDRQRTGLVLDMSVADNLALEVMSAAPMSRRGWLQKKAMRSVAQQLIADYDIRCSGPDQAVRELSGGNQQKVLLAREMTLDPKVLVVSQPTRGLDIGAIDYIHSRLRTLRDRGCAILLISSELDEVLVLSDRIGTLYAGRLMSVTERTNIQMDALSLEMAGQHR
jgi:ABC-type uncharacterized transport system ATPase subunit